MFSFAETNAEFTVARYNRKPPFLNNEPLMRPLIRGFGGGSILVDFNGDFSETGLIR